jgi:class 3 adenylate cyclase
VSFLISDIERSTELVRQLGRERYEALLRDHRTIISEAVEAFGGSLVDSQGDSTFTVFGRASDAVRAAARAQHELAGGGWPDDAVLRVPMGIHTGEATLSNGSYHGLAVHRAARICSEATGGQVLVSHATVSMIEDARDALAGVSLVEVGERRLRTSTSLYGYTCSRCRTAVRSRQPRLPGPACSSSTTRRSSEPASG